MSTSDFAAAEAALQERLSQLEADELESETGQAEPDADEPGPVAEQAGEPEEAAPPDDADEAPAEAPDSGAQPAESAVTAPQPVPQPPTESPTVEPFRLRADGVDIDVPGAIVSNGYVAMPVESLRRYLQPHIVADRRSLQQQAEERGKQKALADIDNHPRIAETKVYKDTFERLRQMTLEQAVEWAIAFKQDEHVLAAKAEANYWKAHAETHQQRESQTREQESQAELEAQKDATLRGHLQNVLGSPELQGLKLDANKLFDRLRYDRRTYERADRDYPELGIKAGDEVVGKRFWDVIEQEATDARSRATNAQKASTVAQRNAAALGQAQAKKPAPTVSTKGAHAAAEVSKVRKEPTSWAEFEELAAAVMKE